MLIQLFDRNTGEPTGYLRHAKEIKIESTLSDGDERLSFLVPRDTEIHNEDYARTKDNEYVIKLLSPQSDTNWMPVEATLNTEDLEGKAWKAFESVEQTAQACLNLAFAGTGWTVQIHGDLKKKRTIRMTGSSWEVLQQALKTYRYETRLDAKEKVCHLYERRGEDKGVYFKDGLNLKKLAVQSDSYSFYTRIRPEGKEGLTIADINDGRDYLENHGYSTKVKTLYWKDERYTVAQNLKEDAEDKLAELAAPAVAYTTEVRDLAAMKPETYTILSYEIGDVITLIDRATVTHEEQRIVKLIRYPDTPWKNACEIANRAASFDTVQQEQNSVNTTVNNITSTNDLIAASALDGVIESSSFGQLIVQDLIAVTARIGHLEATTAEITELYAKKAYVSELLAGYAKITELDVTNARIESAEIKVADIETLVNGNLTSDNILSLVLTSDKVTADTLFVKTQIASKIAVNDLVAGTIYTEKQKITSEDGALLIQGPTMQFKDENSKVRLQIGRDAYGHFNFILIGEDPTKGAILDQDGIHTGAVPDGLIVDIMISDNANISGDKINIPSLVTEINSNTETIKSSLIAYDPTGQTLDVFLGQLETTTESLETTTESMETSIGIQQGKIDGLISDSVIVNSDGTTTKLKDAFTSFKITLDGIQTIVTDHESRFGDYATTEAMTSAITQAKNEITTTVSQTYVTKDSLDNYSTTEQMNSAITQKGNSILLTVSQTYVTEEAMGTAFGYYWSASETATAIKQSAKEIELSVSSTYATITDQSTLQERISSAELKLTDKAITMAVSNGINAGNPVSTTKFTLDGSGGTFKNGGIKIQNNQGTNVLYADTSGNLKTLNMTADNMTTNNMTAVNAYLDGGTMTTYGYYSGEKKKAIDFQGNSIYFYSLMASSGSRLAGKLYNWQGASYDGLGIWGATDNGGAVVIGAGSNTNTGMGIIVRATSTTVYNFNNASTEKIKCNIEEIKEDVKKIILNAKIYGYNLNAERDSYGDAAPRHYGFVVERETPDAVISMERDAVDTYTMAAINWQATKEIYTITDNQQLRIDQLEQENAELKERIKTLENRMIA